MKTFKSASTIALIYGAIIILINLAIIISREFFIIETNLFDLPEAIIHLGASIYLLIMFRHLSNTVIKDPVLHKRINTLLGVEIGSILLVIFMLVSAANVILQALSFDSMSSGFGNMFLAVVLLFILEIVKLVTYIRLGNKIRTKKTDDHPWFKILGILMMVYSLFIIIQAFGIIGNEEVSPIVRGCLMIVMGFAFKQYEHLTPVEPVKTPKPVKKVKQPKTKTSTTKTVAKKPTTKRQVEHPIEHEPIKTTVQHHEDLPLITSYFDNLPPSEVKRLQALINSKYPHITEAPKIKVLIFQYILDKKLYDHNRFMPQ